MKIRQKEKFIQIKWFLNGEYYLEAQKEQDALARLLDISSKGAMITQVILFEA